MIQNKKSFKEKAFKKSSKKVLGSEFGAIIQNDPKNYPQTGQWRDQRPVVDAEKCIGCGMCVANCPEKTIRLVGKKAKVDYQFCKGCGACAEVCPVKAILMEKE